MWNESFFSAPQLKRDPLGSNAIDAMVLRLVVAVSVLSGPPLGGQQWRPGISLDAAWDTWTVVGDIRDRELVMATIELTRPLLTARRITMRYVVTATPLGVVASPRSEKSNTPSCVDVCPFSGIWSGWDKRYGAGVAPLGVQLEIRISRSLAITGAAHGGALWFSRSVPVDGAGRVAFVARLNAGAAVTIPVLGRLRGGYGLLHLSNAGLAARNPGLNAHLWFLGWSP